VHSGRRLSPTLLPSEKQARSAQETWTDRKMRREETIESIMFTCHTSMKKAK
jgi:hypothetical protein